MTEPTAQYHPLSVVLGSACFHAGLGLMTLVFSLLVLALRPAPHPVRERVARLWCRSILAWLRITCRIRHRVSGYEHLPAGPAVILSKHQSAWETIAFRAIFGRPLSWVVKRSLLRIPFYGWALQALEEIGIDREAGRDALRHLDREGRRHLALGRWVVVFPEGTRVVPGESAAFAVGGARLACRAGVPIVPVGLNSGQFWPANDWRKFPGTIEMEIGPAIDTRSRTPAEVNELAREWIERTGGIAQGGTSHASGASTAPVSQSMDSSTGTQ